MPSGIYDHSSKIKESKREDNKICSCGCGNIIPFFKFHKYKMPDYIKGHGRKNRHNSIQHNEAIKIANKKYEDINCPVCNKLFYPSNKKYCSKDCYTKAMIGVSPSKECIEKARLSSIGHMVTEETREKISLANSGEGNGRWKEITIQKIRHSIRKRDNFVCLMCGLHQEKNKKSLDVHHIDYDEINNIPQNLISLCHSCHAKTNKSKRMFWIEHCRSILKDKYNYEYKDKLTFEILKEV